MIEKDFSQNRDQDPKKAIRTLNQYLGMTKILENLEEVLKLTGIETSLAFLTTVKAIRSGEYRDYKLIIEFFQSEVPKIQDEKQLLHYYQAFSVFCMNAEPTVTTLDDGFEFLWKHAASLPEPLQSSLKGEIAVKEVVPRLRLQRNKLAIFEMRFAKQVGEVPLPTSIKEIRPAVIDTIALVTELFPKESIVRDACIDLAGRKLVTNPAETDALYGLSLNLENFHKSDGLAFLDLPDIVSKFFEKKEEKFVWLRYFTGKASLDELISVLGSRFGIKDKTLRTIAEHALINFQDASPLVRSFVLLPLLDDLEGLLSEESWRLRVKEMVLGPYFKNKIASAVYDSYFKSLPPGERRVILAGILAGFIDLEEGRSVFLRNLIYGLKAMGIKSAQIFRAAGFAPPELHKELDEVFDAASPVRRDLGLKSLRQAFGQELEGYSISVKLWGLVVQIMSGI